MQDERPEIRYVSWRDLFPSLLLLRVFRVAISPSLLVLATLGMLAAPIGWTIAEKLFVGNSVSADSTELDEIRAAGEQWTRRSAPSFPALPPNTGPTLRPRMEMAIQLLQGSLASLVEIPTKLAAPFVRLFRMELSVTEAAYYLFGALWSLIVWAVFGGAISRAAALRLGLEEQFRLTEILQHTIRRFPHYFTAPLFPMLGVLFCAFLMLPVGAVMLFDVGVLIAGAAWGVVILFGVVSVGLLLGLLFAWPLMWGALSVESRGDAFEALSRSYAYTFQRPLHYAGYAAITLLLGAIGWVVVLIASEIVISQSHWLISWGLGIENLYLPDGDSTRLSEISAAMGGVSNGNSMRLGATFINCWESLVRFLVAAYPFSFFWCASTAIYLVLRYHVDEAEFDDVFMPDDDGQPLATPGKDDANTASEGTAANEGNEGTQREP